MNGNCELPRIAFLASVAPKPGLLGRRRAHQLEGPSIKMRLASVYINELTR
jgi:hypothetical protein